eukprot:89361-Prymnesium_polylepis.1
MRGRETDGSERPCVSHACPPSTCYPATLHIVASDRAPCPTCPQPPCLVRMLNEPFMQARYPLVSYGFIPRPVSLGGRIARVHGGV